MAIFNKLMEKVRESLGVRSPSKLTAAATAEYLKNVEEGIKQGSENPVWWIDEDGSFRSRDLTPEERQEHINAIFMCAEIVARAFPGFFDDIDEEEVQYGQE